MTSLYSPGSRSGFLVTSYSLFSRRMAFNRSGGIAPLRQLLFWYLIIINQLESYNNLATTCRSKLVAGLGVGPRLALSVPGLWAQYLTIRLPRDKLYERTDKLSIFISCILGTVKEVLMMGCLFLFSCPAWTRTRDYSINSRVFYQLNYGTITRFICTILTQKECFKRVAVRIS